MNLLDHRTPRPVRRALAASYWRLQCLRTDWSDRSRIRSEGLTGIPPAWLRYSVGGRPDLDGYLKVGQRLVQDLEAALAKVGCRFADAGDVLDFGCGSGRTLRFLQKYSPPARFSGADIHRGAIDWCRRNLPFAEYVCNDPLPPLPYPDHSFDVVYGISVLTHLNEEFQNRWLVELRRIARPGGIVLLTVHGAVSLAKLPAPLAAELDLDRTGFAFLENDAWLGVFPKWYQSSFHTRDYVQRVFGGHFEVLDHLEGGMGANQDVVLLRRPAADPGGGPRRPAGEGGRA